MFKWKMFCCIRYLSCSYCLWWRVEYNVSIIWSKRTKSIKRMCQLTSPPSKLTQSEQVKVHSTLCVSLVFLKLFPRWHNSPPVTDMLRNKKALIESERPFSPQTPHQHPSVFLPHLGIPQRWRRKVWQDKRKVNNGGDVIKNVARESFRSSRGS